MIYHFNDEQMNTLDYILANYQREKYQKSIAERAALRALVNTLNKEELMTLRKKVKRGYSKWSVGRGLYDRATKVLSWIEPQRNESISTLLKYFTDKKSGKVVEARVKLRDRFSKQSFKMQRKILKAMLYATKQDRIWAYNRLNYRWDNFFFEDVKALWEQFHEPESEFLVIRDFPMEYVYDNLAALDTGGNYIGLCIKLIHHPLFRIDKERLKEDYLLYDNSEKEYLYILAKSKSKVEKGFATDILFKQMTLFLNAHNTPPDNTYKFKKQVIEGNVSTMHFDFVSSVLWSMGELGLVEELMAFEEWDDKVKDNFLCNEDLERILRNHTFSYEKDLWDLFRQTIAECLPSKYQQLIQMNFTQAPKPTKEELTKKNPAMDILIKKLGLEVM